MSFGLHPIKNCWPWLCAILSGVLCSLAFPPVEQAWLAWIGFGPLIAAIWFAPTCRRPQLRALGLGFVFGLTHFYSLFYWITTVTFIGWLALIPYLAIYPAVWSWMLSRWLNPNHYRQRGSRSIWLSSTSNLRVAFLGAAIWCSTEFLRGWLFTGFGWNVLGVSQFDQTFLIQGAAFTGVYGISFLIVLINLIAVITVKRLVMEVGQTKLRPHLDFNLAIVIVVLFFVYGIRHFVTPIPTINLKVAAIQPNIPQDEKWATEQASSILTRLSQLTELAIAANPDLLVWPEAATPRPLLHDQFTFNTVRDFTSRMDGDFLIGSLYFSPDGDFNSAIFLANRGNSIERYDKMHLVPFGEFIPFRKTFPLFAWIAGDLVPGDFTSGKEANVFQLSQKDVRIAPLICFEDTIGRVTRRFFHAQPQLLVNITNDGWFLESSASRQHLANAVFRCVELNLPMLRCANTGVTAIIDRYGRVTQRVVTPEGSTFTEGILIGSLAAPATPPKTFYARYGEVFSYACLLLTVLTPLLQGSQIQRSSHS